MIRFIPPIDNVKSSDDYATPKKFYDKINAEFNFDFDPCPLRSQVNGLEIDWIGNVYCNPPYSNIEPFLNKAIKELNNGNAKKVVFLIPIRSDTKYWHNLIMKNASEIRFVKGRLNFNESKTPAPFPCVLIVFEKEKKQLIINSYTQ